MKVVILAGGFGIRLSEYTDSIPKPLVTIGDRPILWHIMKSYAHFGYKNFYLALGYKGSMVKDYFLNYGRVNADFSINLADGKIKTYQTDCVDWKVSLIDTGLNAMTGGRVKRMRPYIGNNTFLLTYGDGLSDINIESLVKFHKSHGKMVTVTAVHPGARFGELKLDGERVSSFQEKPQTTKGWINGGYFVIEPEFFDLIDDDDTILERSPLEKVAEKGQLMAYSHQGFWQCMDTKRDRDHLNNLWHAGDAPWKR